jgi:four helix bundle protein
LQIENCRLPQEENVMTPDELVERLLNFAARVGKVVDALPDTRMGRHIGGQLVRSGISPAPNYEEGCAAESRAGFVHKLSICLKELRESRSWIPLIIKTNMLPEHRMGELLDECNQLGNIIGQSIMTARGNQRTDNREHRQQVKAVPFHKTAQAQGSA